MLFALFFTDPTFMYVNLVLSQDGRLVWEIGMRFDRLRCFGIFLTLVRCVILTGMAMDVDIFSGDSQSCRASIMFRSNNW